MSTLYRDPIRDPISFALNMLGGGGEQDSESQSAPPQAPFQAPPNEGGGSEDFVSHNIDAAGPDEAASTPNPFDMASHYIKPRAVKKIPWWGYLATGLLDAINLRQQLHPGRDKAEVQYGHGRKRNIYTARQAPPSSNAFANLLAGHTAQKREAQGEADKYNHALDLMGLQGSMKDALAQREQDRKPQTNPLASFGGNPDVAEAAAIQQLMGGEPGRKAALERIQKPKAAKPAPGTAPGVDYRTAALLVQHDGFDPTERPDLVEEKMQWIANMRKADSGESNANRAAALKNEIDSLARQINTLRERHTALKSRIAMQSTLTPSARARYEADAADAEHQAELLSTDWANKNQELANLPTKSKTTGSPRPESPTTDPLGGGSASGQTPSDLPQTDFPQGSPSPIESPWLGGSPDGQGQVTEPQASKRRPITEHDLTPDVVRRIRSNPDWKDRAREMFPNRPEFR